MNWVILVACALLLVVIVLWIVSHRTSSVEYSSSSFIPYRKPEPTPPPPPPRDDTLNIALVTPSINRAILPLYSRHRITSFIVDSEQEALELYPTLGDYDLIIGARFSYELAAWNDSISHVPLISIDATADIPLNNPQNLYRLVNTDATSFDVVMNRVRLFNNMEVADAYRQSVLFVTQGLDYSNSLVATYVRKYQQTISDVDEETILRDHVVYVTDVEDAVIKLESVSLPLIIYAALGTQDVLNDIGEAQEFGEEIPGNVIVVPEFGYGDLILPSFCTLNGQRYNVFGTSPEVTPLPVNMNLPFSEHQSWVTLLFTYAVSSVNLLSRQTLHQDILNRFLLDSRGNGYEPLNARYIVSTYRSGIYETEVDDYVIVGYEDLEIGGALNSVYRIDNSLITPTENGTVIYIGPYGEMVRIDRQTLVPCYGRLFSTMTPSLSTRSSSSLLRF